MTHSNENIRNSWNRQSDGYYKKLYEGTNALQLLKSNPWLGFPSEVCQTIREKFPSLQSKRVCVPSSGDNIAAFAFHLLGASVTSCDISSEQIKNARMIAKSEGWNIEFHIDDSMELQGLNNDEYDLVYTSNGVHVWICNLEAMYGAFRRILKDGGKYIFFETHPFIRPFDDKTNELRIIKPYDEIGPFGNPSNFLWRLCDFVNALISSKFKISNMNEFFAEKTSVGSMWWGLDEWDEKADWHKNPYAALPQWVSFCSVKENEACPGK